VKIAVLITCFNRRVITEACLYSFFASQKISGLEFDVYLTDGGSTDGTPNTIRQKFPSVIVFEGNDLYWNEGMNHSWNQASNKAYDGFLLLNDDLNMNLRTLINLQEAITNCRNQSLIVGRTISAVNGKTTYGALAPVKGLSKLRFILAFDSATTPVTMNGNFVYVPKPVYDALGTLSTRFRHAMGDIDYGLRASKSGFSIIELHAPVANQEYNYEWSNRNRYLTFRNIRQMLMHPKGVPVREWYFFCRNHGGCLWPVNFFMRYVFSFRK
jgi:GT2 family glycosyltransferase